MERGVGHKHSVYPVFNLSEIIDYQHQCSLRKKSGSGSASGTTTTTIPSIGPGPILLFSGDAAMTIDPILAQGFTIAMESAADFAKTLELCLTTPIPTSTSTNPPTTSSNDDYDDDNDEMTIKRSIITQALVDRNQRRYERLLCLLRATTLVQEISQPSSSPSSSHGSTTIPGLISKYVIRPTMMVTPSFMKEAVFSYMIQYSLGLKGRYSLYNKSSCDITKAAKVNTR